MDGIHSVHTHSILDGGLSNFALNIDYFLSRTNIAYALLPVDDLA